MNAKSAGFEDISVVSYDRSTQGGALEADLAAACGVEVRPGARASNVSSPTALSDRLRLFNAVRAEMEGGAVDAMLQAHEGIRPGDRFFDQADDVEEALGQDRELQEILDARIARQRVPVTLVPDRFADLATQLETLAGPLFPTIKAHHGEYSTLEAGDLGPLRGRMWLPFEAEQGGGARPSCRASCAELPLSLRPLAPASAPRESGRRLAMSASSSPLRSARDRRKPDVRIVRRAPPAAGDRRAALSDKR